MGRRLASMRGELPPIRPQELRAFALREVDKLSVAAIAERFGVSPHTVSYWIMRVRKAKKGGVD